jgi:HAD superfamily hydrolase (TIGR01509 family)
MKKAFIFDLGAVVFRWRPAVVLARVLPEHVPDAARAQALARLFFQGADSPWGRFDRGLVSLPELLAEQSRHTGLTQDEVLSVVEAVPEELQPLPETVAWIRQLQAAGHPLFFLSNMPAPYADHLEAVQPVMRRFRGGVFSARVQLGKPEAAIFRFALERFGLLPQQAVFIDDHPANVAAARECGLAAVQFVDAIEAARQAQALLAVDGDPTRST